MLSFGVYEKNTKTNQEQFLEVKLMRQILLLHENCSLSNINWKPRKNVKLILKTPIGI
jgi:hypothetical protein